MGSWPDNRDERTDLTKSKRDTGVEKKIAPSEGESAKSDSWKGRTSQRQLAGKEDPATAT